MIVAEYQNETNRRDKYILLGTGENNLVIKDRHLLIVNQPFLYNVARLYCDRLNFSSLQGRAFESDLKSSPSPITSPSTATALLNYYFPNFSRDMR